LKGLTIRQPWAWCITTAGKDVENRGKRPPAAMLGQLFAIQAGTAFEDHAPAHLRHHRIADPPRRARDYERGVVVAVARLSGFIGPEGAVVAAEGVSPDSVARRRSSAWFSGPWGWCLDDVVVLGDPIKVRGMPGPFDLPAAVEAAVRAQL